MSAEDRHTMSVAFQGYSIAGANLMSYLLSLDVRKYKVDYPEGFDIRWMSRERDLKQETKCLQNESLRTKQSVECVSCHATIPEASPIQMTGEIPIIICPACVKAMVVS